MARSWGAANIKAGDEILLTEHGAPFEPGALAAVGRRARRCFAPHSGYSDDGLLNIEKLPGLLSERTKMVAFAAVSNVLGTINPVAEITRQAHAAGAVVLVDAAQSVPHMAADVQAL